MDADNQQGSLRELANPSETIRWALESSEEEIVRAAWRHAEAGGDDRPASIDDSNRGQSADIAQCTSNRPERNSLSGKNYLPRRSARDGRVPAHIGEALPPSAKGNPEGSPSDPVTTDPKGEAGRGAAQRQEDATCNTPALITTSAAYGVRVPLDPWYVSGLTEGEGCFCISFAVRHKLRTGVEVRPSFSLSLNEKDLELLMDLQAFFGCGWIRESKTDRTFKYEARAVGDLLDPIIPHFERHPLRGSKATSFETFASVCRMIEQGDHLWRDGLRSIIDIAYEMNLGTRRLARDDLLRALVR
jgi:LAGLIDADG endonuclease